MRRIKALSRPAMCRLPRREQRPGRPHSSAGRQGGTLGSVPLPKRQCWVLGACDSIQQQGASLVRAITKTLQGQNSVSLQANRHSSLLNPELEVLGLTRLLQVPSPCPFSFNPEGNLIPSSNTGAHPKSHHVKQDKCHPGGLRGNTGELRDD